MVGTRHNAVKYSLGSIIFCVIIIFLLSMVRLSKTISKQEIDNFENLDHPKNISKQDFENSDSDNQPNETTEITSTVSRSKQFIDNQTVNESTTTIYPTRVSVSSKFKLKCFEKVRLSCRKSVKQVNHVNTTLFCIKKLRCFKIPRLTTKN